MQKMKTKALLTFMNLLLKKKTQIILHYKKIQQHDYIKINNKIYFKIFYNQ